MNKFFQTCLTLLILSFISCSLTKNAGVQNVDEIQGIKVSESQKQKTFLDISLFAKIDENEKNMLQINAILFTMFDSIRVNQIEIESPSFVKPGLSSAFESFFLMTGQTKSQVYNFIISKNESFKLKGIVFGDTNNGKTKVSAIKNLFFYWDENHYIISDDITQMIGQKKNNGDLITIEDLKIFNRVEIE